MKNVTLIAAMALAFSSIASANQEWVREYVCESAPEGSNASQVHALVESNLIALTWKLTLHRSDLNGLYSPVSYEVVPMHSRSRVRYSGNGASLVIDLASGMESLPPHYSAVLVDQEVTQGRRFALTCREANGADETN